MDLPLAGESVTGRDIAQKLLRERNVTVVPGSGFGNVSEHFIRVSLAGPDAGIEQGLRELCALLHR